MRTLSVGLVLFAANAIVHGQTTFETLLDCSSSYQESISELASHNVLVDLAWGPGISLLDPSGNVIHSNSFWSDSMLSIGAIRKRSENEFYFSTGYGQASCAFPGSGGGRVNPCLGKMDSLGNVMSLHHYTLNAGCFNYAGNLQLTTNKDVVLWGGEDFFFTLRVDSTMAPVWSKHFGEVGSFRFIKELPSGDLLAGFDMPVAGASVARLDANGDFVWCKSYMRPLGRMHDAIVESDSSFIITGFTSTTNAKLFMMELDGEGEVQWCRGYGSGAYDWYTPQWSQLERTLDGNYAVLATLGQGGFFFRPFLMKTDLNGDTLWARSMGADGYIYHTRDLLVAFDGGYVFSGVIWGDLPELNSGIAYIFKSDSLGNFSCLSRTHSVQLFDLFPADSSFTLTSMDGATMHQAFVGDTTFAPLPVYDACEVANGLNPRWERPGERRLRIRPNPNTGHFTLAFPDPLMAQSYYSVYDAVGKLLYQRPLPTGATVSEVDLSRFGAGTYVIKLTQPEGACYERVVVE